MAKKAKTNKRGASRGGSRKRAPKKTVPGWVWLFTGLMVGLFIAFLVHLGQTQMEQGTGPSAKAEPPASSEPEQTDEEESQDSGPKFDFYAVLPKMEVIVPQDEEKKQQQAQKRQAAKPPEKTRPSQPRSTPDKPSPNDQRYLLQAGSFRNTQDADRRRAELILQGFQASIQAVNLDNGDSWHRVMIGPYDNLNTMKKAKQNLASNGIETLPIKMKK